MSSYENLFGLAREVNDYVAALEDHDEAHGIERSAERELWDRAGRDPNFGHDMVRTLRGEGLDEFRQCLIEEVDYDGGYGEVGHQLAGLMQRAALMQWGADQDGLEAGVFALIDDHPHGDDIREMLTLMGANRFLFLERSREIGLP